MAKRERKDRGKKNQPEHYSSQWNVVDDLRVDVPDPSKVHRRAKNIRRALIIAPAVAIVAVMLGATASNQVSDLQTKVDSWNREVTMKTPGKDVAMMQLEQWMKGKNPPLPNGYLVSWDGRELLSEYEIVVDPDTEKTVEKLGREVHRFTLANNTGVLYQASVMTLWSPHHGSVTVGSPTLMPKTPTASESLEAPTWPNLEESMPDEHLDTSIKSWTDSYVSGDPAKLRQTVGDPVASNSYMPMVGVKSAVPTVIAMGTSEEMAKQDRAIAQVELKLTWASNKNSDNSDDLPTISFDLLIDKVSTASPVVVAWTEAGMGESLQPYQNANSKINITVENNTYSVQPNSDDEGLEGN